jgi:hypothetical protein
LWNSETFYSKAFVFAKRLRHPRQLSFQFSRVYGYIWIIHPLLYYELSNKMSPTIQQNLQGSQIKISLSVESSSRLHLPLCWFPLKRVEDELRNHLVLLSQRKGRRVATWTKVEKATRKIWYIQVNLIFPMGTCYTVCIVTTRPFCEGAMAWYGYPLRRVSLCVTYMPLILCVLEIPCLTRCIQLQPCPYNTIQFL